MDQAGTSDPTTAAIAVRLLALGYAAVTLPFVAALLPRDDKIYGFWLVPGLAILAVVVGFAGWRVYGVATGSPRPESASRALAENLACLVGLACASYGLTGTFGMYRLTMLAPVLLMAALGTDRMLAASWATAVSLLVALTAGSTADVRVVPAFAVVYGAGFLLTALFVRTLARAARRATNETRMFSEITDVAARASHMYTALDDLMPVLHRYLDATRVVALPVRHRLVEEVAIAEWPANGAPVDGPELNDVRIAAVDGRTIVREEWMCAPVRGNHGVELVLFVERNERKLLTRLSYDDALERVATQLGALLIRLDLIADLEGLTRTDSLTGLPNRRALAERLERELAVARRSNSPLSLAMIDLDFFKQYNDTFGHVAGDELLHAVADMLKVRLRATDFVARYGGEEFCVILPFTIAADAATILMEIHRRGRELDRDRTLTFSAGVAEWNGDEPMDDLIDRADRALYQAKSSGRAQTQVARNLPARDGDERPDRSADPLPDPPTASPVGRSPRRSRSRAEPAPTAPMAVSSTGEAWSLAPNAPSAPEPVSQPLPDAGLGPAPEPPVARPAPPAPPSVLDKLAPTIVDGLTRPDR